MLKWMVILTGLLTAIVVAAPQVVIVGLIFPGLVLAVTPTLFVYLLGTLLIRYALPIRSELTATLVAFPLTMAVSAIAMLPSRIEEKRKFMDAALPDIAPAGTLKIVANVLVDWRQYQVPIQTRLSCDYLTAALLDTPGVTSVTRIEEKHSATF